MNIDLPPLLCHSDGNQADHVLIQSRLGTNKGIATWPALGAIHMIRQLMA